MAAAIRTRTVSSSISSSRSRMSRNASASMIANSRDGSPIGGGPSTSSIDGSSIRRLLLERLDLGIQRLQRVIVFDGELVAALEQQLGQAAALRLRIAGRRDQLGDVVAVRQV